MRVSRPGELYTILMNWAAPTSDLAAGMTPEQDGRYGGLVRANNALMASGTSSGLTADAAARVVARAVTARRPRTRYTVGRDATLVTGLARMLSDRAIDASSPPTCAAARSRAPGGRGGIHVDGARPVAWPTAKGRPARGPFGD